MRWGDALGAILFRQAENPNLNSRYKTLRNEVITFVEKNRKGTGGKRRNLEVKNQYHFSCENFVDLKSIIPQKIMMVL